MYISKCTYTSVLDRELYKINIYFNTIQIHNTQLF